MIDTQIRLATVADIKFCDHVRAKLGNALGFLPLAAYEGFIAKNGIHICEENNENAGYYAVHAKLAYQPRLASITHAAVLMDAQRRHHGLTLLDHVCAIHRANGQLAIQACCAEDLESNSFWRAAGFRAIAITTPDTASGREIIVWRKILTAQIPDWFAQLPHKSGHRARATLSVRDTTKDYSEILARISKKCPKVLSNSSSL